MFDHAKQKRRRGGWQRKRSVVKAAGDRSVVLPKNGQHSSVGKAQHRSRVRTGWWAPLSTEPIDFPLVGAKPSRTVKLGLLITSGCAALVILSIILWVSPTSIANWGLPNLYAPLLLSVGLLVFCLARIFFVNPVALLIACWPVILLSLHLQHFSLNWTLTASIGLVLTGFAVVSIIIRALLRWGAT